MDTALIVALTAAAVVWLTFCAWYLIRARWWESPFGWNTVGVSLVLSAIFGRLALLVYHPEVRADLEETGLTLYIAAFVLGIHRIYLLEKTQREQ